MIKVLIHFDMWTIYLYKYLAAQYHCVFGPASSARLDAVGLTYQD